jgi:hypothetical protein
MWQNACRDTTNATKSHAHGTSNMSVNDAFFGKQASGLRRLARESSEAACSALVQFAEEYRALSVSQKKPWPPLADGPRDKAVAGEDGAIATAAPVGDRRRPGRVDYANLALVELLRARAGDGTEHELIAGPIEDAEPNLLPAKGILIGAGLGLSMWSVGGLLFWLMR